MKTKEIQDQVILEDGIIYDIVNNLVIRQLEAGIVPWQKKWEGLPFAQNLITRSDYRGINRITTNLSPCDNPYFLSWAQIESLGGKIRDHSIPVPYVYWERPKEEDSYKVKSFLLWNVEQIEGVSGILPEREYPGKPLEEAEGIVEGMPNRPRIRREGLSPAYFPESDIIQVPPIESFENPHNFYQLLFQLLVFATGAKQRLARDTVIQARKLDAYDFSLETLTAEFASQTLCNIAGLAPNRSFTTSSVRIQNWLSKLKANKLFVFLAASQAKRAVDYILG